MSETNSNAASKAGRLVAEERRLTMVALRSFLITANVPKYHTVARLTVEQLREVRSWVSEVQSSAVGKEPKPPENLLKVLPKDHKLQNWEGPDTIPAPLDRDGLPDGSQADKPSGVHPAEKQPYESPTVTELGSADQLSGVPPKSSSDATPARGTPSRESDAGIPVRDRLECCAILDYAGGPLCFFSDINTKPRGNQVKVRMLEVRPGEAVLPSSQGRTRGTPGSADLGSVRSAEDLARWHEVSGGTFACAVCQHTLAPTIRHGRVTSYKCTGCGAETFLPTDRSGLGKRVSCATMPTRVRLPKNGQSLGVTETERLASDLLTLSADTLREAAQAVPDVFQKAQVLVWLSLRGACQQLMAAIDTALLSASSIRTTPQHGSSGPEQTGQGQHREDHPVRTRGPEGPDPDHGERPSIAETPPMVFPAVGPRDFVPSPVLCCVECGSVLLAPEGTRAEFRGQPCRVICQRCFAETGKAEG